MIDLSLLTDGGVGWLDASGPSSHLVLSTRIRLARNLAGHVFQGRNSETEREEILDSVERVARESVLLRQATRFPPPETTATLAPTASRFDWRPSRRKVRNRPPSVLLWK